MGKSIFVHKNDEWGAGLRQALRTKECEGGRLSAKLIIICSASFVEFLHHSILHSRILLWRMRGVWILEKEDKLCLCV